MEKLSVVLLVLISTYSFGQSSINSGASTNNDLIYSVGEIFTLPTSPDEVASGTVGAVSYIEFFVVGVDEVLTSDDMRVYPNPTTGALQFKVVDYQTITEVSVLDVHGKLVLKKAVDGNRVDLSELISGVYFIQINQDNSQLFKIIKQ